MPWTNASRICVPAARRGVDTGNSVRCVEAMPLKTLADVTICGNHVTDAGSRPTPREAE